jgi:hypothetical protein
MNKLQTFVIWLDGFLDAAGPNLSIVQTTAIKNKLNNIFERVAEEPTKPNPTLEQLGATFGFPVKPGLPGETFNGEVMRC